MDAQEGKPKSSHFNDYKSILKISLKEFSEIVGY